MFGKYCFCRTGDLDEWTHHTMTDNGLLMEVGFFAFQERPTPNHRQGDNWGAVDLEEKRNCCRYLGISWFYWAHKPLPNYVLQICNLCHNLQKGLHRTAPKTHMETQKTTSITNNLCWSRREIAAMDGIYPCAVIELVRQTKRYYPNGNFHVWWRTARTSTSPEWSHYFPVFT